MHIAALIGCLGQRLAQRRSEAGMIVGDDKLDAMQTTGFEPQQKIPPARSALPVGELDRQHLAPAVPVDCSAVRTSARRNSSSSLRRALTSIVPDLPCRLVMVCILAKGSGDCDITRIP